ncbi:hypothetical protein SCHPADRAFT_941219 [Schizopora paradoxa]|uniref:Uncharacterized protein n=1 Tax=Schizopora paradoxa TaxID=27342 RepID=A0A0H2RKG4_9AGAM|nr:hypothetical protein SCHPADRAFT_941219 [Schizopora paradoxa]
MGHPPLLFNIQAGSSAAPDIDIEPPSRSASVSDVFALQEIIGAEDTGEGPEDPTGGQSTSSNGLTEVTSAFGGMIVDEPLEIAADEPDSHRPREDPPFTNATSPSGAHIGAQRRLQNPRRRMGWCDIIFALKIHLLTVYILVIPSRQRQPEAAVDRLSPGSGERVNSVSVLEMQTFRFI